MIKVDYFDKYDAHIVLRSIFMNSDERASSHREDIHCRAGYYLTDTFHKVIKAGVDMKLNKVARKGYYIDRANVGK